MKILSVDDSFTMRRIIANAASVLDITTLEAPEAESALDILEQEGNNLSLILLDWNMPGLNGLELLKRIKAHPAWKDVPVMMVTSESNRAAMIEAIQAGAKNYLTKPFAQEDLVTKIMQTLGQGQLQ